MSTVLSYAASATLPAAGLTARSEVEKIRVLHLVNGEHFAGAERVQLHLAHRLPDCGFEADFACLKPRRFVQHFDAARGELFQLPMSSRFDLRVARRIADIVGRGQHRLLHAHTPRTAMAAALASRRTGVPWIYHVHSPTANDSDRRWQNRVNNLVERLSLTNCASLITVSESLRRSMLARGWSESRVSLVHNGVPAVESLRREPPLPGTPWTFGMIALMRPRKGVETLLHALRLCVHHGHDVSLHLVGEFETAEYEQQTRHLAYQLGVDDRIQWLGFTRDVPAALARLDALVLPSLYGEGLPMVVLEAMAARLPVVATHVEGTPEAIRHGVDGLLAEPNDPVDLAAQMESLVSGEYCWSRLSESAWHRHADHFSDLAMSRGVAAVYRSVLHEHHGIEARI